jgi:signal peptidase I
MRAVVLVALVLGCHRDALLDDPPPSTWFAAHLDLTTDDARAQLTLPVVQQLHACGIDAFADIGSVDVAIASDALVATVQSRVSAASARCAVDAFALSPTVEPMIDSFGGVVSIVVPIDAGARAGLPADVRAELARGWRTAPIAVAVASDAPERWGFVSTSEQALWFDAPGTAFEVNGRIAIALESFPEAPRPILDGRFVRFARNRDLVSDIGQALALRLGLIEAARYPSSLMAPTIDRGDHLFLLKTGVDAQRRGRVVWYRDGRLNQISRIVGLAGDRVRFSHGAMSINGRGVPLTRTLDGWIEDLDGWKHAITNNERVDDDVVVPPEHVLLVDDNRVRGGHRVVDVDDIKSEVVIIWNSSDASGVRWSRIGRWLGRPAR